RPASRLVPRWGFLKMQRRCECRTAKPFRRRELLPMLRKLSPDTSRSKQRISMPLLTWLRESLRLALAAPSRYGQWRNTGSGRAGNDRGAEALNEWNRRIGSPAGLRKIEAAYAQSPTGCWDR